MKNTVLNISLYTSLTAVKATATRTQDNFIFGEESDGNYIPQAKTVTALMDFNFSCQLLLLKKSTS